MPEVNEYVIFGIVLATLIGLFIPMAKDMVDTKRELRDVRGKYFDTKETLQLVRQERDNSLAQEERLAHIKANTVHTTGIVVGWLPPGLSDRDKAHRIETWDEMAKKKLAAELSSSVFIQTSIDELNGQVNITAHAYVQRHPLAASRVTVREEVSDSDA